MKFKSNVNIVLLLIIALFLITRLFVLQYIPPSVYWDEASIGYNAYSVLMTGKDEWGEFMPLHFRAFGEFKLPVYIYSVIPFIKMFGLNSLAVRLPSVIYFLLCVIAVYLIVYRFTKKQSIALFSSFFMAVTPWIFIFSRAGYEVSAGLAFFLFGIYFFLKVKENKWDIVFSVSSFIASIYSYNSFRIISPLVFVFLLMHQFLSQRSFVKENLKTIFLSVVLLVLSFIPIIKLMFLDYGSLRFQSVALQGSFSQKSTIFVRNYISHFSPSFLFLDGDSNLRSQNPGYGQLYMVSFILILAGFIKLIKEKEKFTLRFVLLLLFLSPIPASITKESPHGLRSIVMIVPFSMISTFGYKYFSELTDKYKKLILVFFPAVYLIYFAGYFYNYIFHYNSMASKDWQYGYRLVFEDINKRNINENTNIYIADDYGQPYIFYLFYNKIHPNNFMNSVTYNPPDRWGMSTVSKIGNVFFYSNSESQFLDNSIIYTQPFKKVSNTQNAGEIYFLNGEKAFDIYTK